MFSLPPGMPEDEEEVRGIGHPHRPSLSNNNHHHSNSNNHSSSREKRAGKWVTESKANLVRIYTRVASKAITIEQQQQQHCKKLEKINTI